MRITDVTLTLFAWQDLPAVCYGPYNPTTARTESELGLVTVPTSPCSRSMRAMKPRPPL